MHLDRGLRASVSFVWQIQDLEYLRSCCVAGAALGFTIINTTPSPQHQHNTTATTSSTQPHHDNFINTYRSTQHHLHFTTSLCTKPSTKHHLHNIFNTTSPTQHHQHITIQTTSSAQHYLHYISVHNTIYTTSSNATSSTYTTYTPSSTQHDQHNTMYTMHTTLSNLISSTHTHTLSTLQHQHNIIKHILINTSPTPSTLCLIPADTPFVILCCGLFFVLFRC